MLRKAICKEKNEISLEANVYIKANSISLGVLEPNSKNLSIKFPEELIKNLYGPYQLFSDVVQENADSFVILLGALKNGQLIQLSLDPQKSEKGKKEISNNSLKFTSHEATQCSKKFGSQDSEHLSTFERLSRPSSRVLRVLEEKQASEIRTQALNIKIDGNFLKQQMKQKYITQKGVTVIKIANKGKKVKPIPWTYYTVNDEYIKHSQDQVKYKSTDSSSDYGSTSDVSGDKYIKQQYMSTVEGNMLHDVNTEQIQRKMDLEDGIQSIKNITATENSCNNDTSSKINCFNTEPFLVDEQANLKSFNIAVQHDSEILNKRNKMKLVTANLESRNEIPETKCGDNNTQDRGDVTLETFKPRETIDLKTKYISYTQDLEESGILENVYENISEREMEKLLLSLIRKATSPISIDIIACNNDESNYTVLELNQHSTRQIQELKRVDEKQSLSQEKEVQTLIDQKCFQIKYNETNNGEESLISKTFDDVSMESKRCYDSGSEVSTVDTSYMDILGNGIYNYCENITMSEETSVDSLHLDRNDNLLSENDKIVYPTLKNVQPDVFSSVDINYNSLIAQGSDYPGNEIHQELLVGKLIKGATLASDIDIHVLEEKETFCHTNYFDKSLRITGDPEEIACLAADIAYGPKQQGGILRPQTNLATPTKNYTPEEPTGGEVPLFCEKSNSEKETGKCELDLKNAPQSPCSSTKSGDSHRTWTIAEGEQDYNLLTSRKLDINELVESSKKLLAAVNTRHTPSEGEETSWWIRLSGVTARDRDVKSTNSSQDDGKQLKTTNNSRLKNKQLKPTSTQKPPSQPDKIFFKESQTGSVPSNNNGKKDRIEESKPTKYPISERLHRLSQPKLKNISLSKKGDSKVKN